MDPAVANSFLRWVLELAALMAMANWGLRTHEGYWAAAWAVGLPLLAAVLWAVFRVPGDLGYAVVEIPVPGIVRLVLEAVYFGGAVWLLRAVNRPVLAVILGAFVVFHYALSYERVLWLITRW